MARLRIHYLVVVTHARARAGTQLAADRYEHRTAREHARARTLTRMCIYMHLPAHGQGPSVPDCCHQEWPKIALFKSYHAVRVSTFSCMHCVESTGLATSFLFRPGSLAGYIDAWMHASEQASRMDAWRACKRKSPPAASCAARMQFRSQTLAGSILIN